MEENKVIVVGVDNGNGSTKTAHTCRFSSVRIVENTLAENILEYEGIRYAVGEKPPAYNSKKYNNTDMYIQTLAAIASELEARNIENNNISVWLASGLPIGHWAHHKDKVKDYFMKKDRVDYLYNGKPYHIKLEGVNVLPQGLASTRSFRNKEQGNIITLDIGYGTLDYLVFHNGMVAESECGSVEYGVNKCFKLSKQAIASVYAEELDYFTFNNYIHGITKGINKSWHDVMDDAIREYCTSVINEAKRVGYNPNTYSLHLMGGGAHLVNRYADELSEVDFTVDLDINSNARGYEFFVKENLKRQGVDYYE